VLGRTLSGDFDAFVGRYGVTVTPADRADFLGKYTMLAVGCELCFRIIPTSPQAISIPRPLRV